jgi:hypothetical protein
VSNGDFPGFGEDAELEGLPAGAGSLRVATSVPEGNFGAFVSGLKIPFPANRDRAKQRLVRMRDGKPSEGVGGTYYVSDAFKAVSTAWNK